MPLPSDPEELKEHYYEDLFVLAGRDIAEEFQRAVENIEDPEEIKNLRGKIGAKAATRSDPRLETYGQTKIVGVEPTQ